MLVVFGGKEARDALGEVFPLDCRLGALSTGRVDVESCDFNGELDGLLAQLGVMSNSDRLEDDRDVDGVGRWSQTGQYPLNGLYAAEEGLC